MKLSFLFLAAVCLSSKVLALSIEVPLEFQDADLLVIDGTWQSFSVEFSYMVDYFGNKSSPNKLSYNTLKNLADRSGKNPIIRAGGTTANRATYNASQIPAVINTFTSNPDQPTKVSINDIWYEAFQTAPEGTKVIYDVNYRDNSTQGVQNTVDEVGRVWTNLRDVLYAFELGKEVEGWNKVGRTPDWSPELYAKDYLNYTAKFEEEVFGGDDVEPLFQGGTFQGSGGRYISEPWNSVNALDAGLNDKGQIKSMSQHDYHGSNCDSTKQIPELRQNLLNHTNVVDRVWPHQQMSSVVKSQGIDYVLGETNSISCQGRNNVSNVFGSALWYLDYTLYVASSSSVAKMYFHMGTNYRYSLWAPFEGAANDSAIIRPSYYGALLLATGIGGNGGEKQVKAVHENETFVAYSLYADSKLDSLFIVNLEPFNATNGEVEALERNTISVDIPGDLPAGLVYRLTAPGSDVKEGATLAGQTVTEEGLVVGEEKTEVFAPGTILEVKDSESILIKFNS